MVLQHTCVDSSAIPALGAHKESHWVIAVGSDAQPLDIRLTVDKSVVKDPEVGVKCNGALVYPDPNVTGKGDKVKAKLQQDFVWSSAFRGKLHGLNVKNKFEVRPEHLSVETWYPATLVEQREDGLFKANVSIPNGSHGDKMVVYPAVNPANIREASGSRQMVVVPRRTIVLTVPKANPMLATLAIDGDELMTHFFARPSPAPPLAAGQPPSGRIPRTKVGFTVTKDRKFVTSSVGHPVLSQFLGNEVRAVDQFPEKLKHSWKFQIGPFATHVVEIEKKYKSSKAVTLSVDGSVLAEGSAEDLESPEGFWLCTFRLLGEKCQEWEVYESDGNGKTVDSKGIVEQVVQHQHECSVYFANGDSLVDARLTVDGQDFSNFKPSAPGQPDAPFTLQPEALMMSYNLHVPYKCTDGAAKKKDSSPKAPGGLGIFACCMGASSVDPKNDMIVDTN